MTHLHPQLDLSRCPHCHVDTPTLGQIWTTKTFNHAHHNLRYWAVYKCARCGGIVTAASNEETGTVSEIFPGNTGVEESIPDKARKYLSQALSSIHAPSGAVILAGSAVDAMLKEKGYEKGSLYTRINKAATDHLITKDMAAWAHQVRLDANGERHADKKDDMPDEQDARKSIDFASALGQILFVLPSRVSRGLEETSSSTDSNK